MPESLLLIDLPERLGCAVPRLSAARVRSFMGDPDRLVIDVEGFQAGYVAWRAEIKASPPDDNRLPWWARTDARIASAERLIEMGRAGLPLRYTSCWRERRGGRRYVLVRPGVRGFELLSRRQWQALRGEPAIWPQSISKTIRSVGLRAPQGKYLAQGDTKSAFLGFLAHLSGDEQMTADLAAVDLHRHVADQLGVARGVAKILNSLLVGLGGATAIQKHLRREGLEIDYAAAHRLKGSWWARYAAARAFRDELQRRYEGAQAANKGVRIIAPDGRGFSFSPAEVGGAVINDKEIGFPTVFSSLWRAIEGTVLDLAMERLQGTKLRLVVPMFDGVVYTVPKAIKPEAAVKAVKEVLEESLWRVGVPGKATAMVDRYWVDEARKPKEQLAVVATAVE